MEIASTSTSEGGRSGSATVEKMLAGTKAWTTKGMPSHQEESVEFKVPPGSIVTSFEIASYAALSKFQMRIEEVSVDGSIGAELKEWNHCGTRRGGYDPHNYTPVSVEVATTATRFKVSVRHIDDSTNTFCAGVAIFRAVGISAPEELPVGIASPATSVGFNSYTVEKMLADTKVWLTKEIPSLQEESFECMVPRGSVVTGFSAATLEACSEKQMRIEEVKMDGSIGAEIFSWNYCGACTGTCWYPSSHTPHSIAVITTATRFKVSVRHTCADSCGPAGVSIFRVLGIAAPPSPPLPVPTSTAASLRHSHADVIDVSCDAVEGATSYMWSKVVGDLTWSKRASDPSSVVLLEEVGPFTLTVRAMKSMHGWFRGGAQLPDIMSAFSLQTNVVNVLEVASKVVRAFTNWVPASTPLTSSYLAHVFSFSLT